MVSGGQQLVDNPEISSPYGLPVPRPLSRASRRATARRPSNRRLVHLDHAVDPVVEGFDVVIMDAAFGVSAMAVARPLLTRHHRAGIRFLRAGRFEEAIRAFGESRDFFTRHPALDRYRFLILMSAGAATYRELAMCNIAYAHARAGAIPAARKACGEALAAFPGSVIARAIADSLPAGPAPGDEPRAD